MKAYRRPDGEVQLFRPEENALRMQRGAERLLMVAPSVEQYTEAVKQVVAANKSWVRTAKFWTSFFLFSSLISVYGRNLFKTDITCNI